MIKQFLTRRRKLKFIKIGIGFTLIELLVVTAITGLLFSIIATYSNNLRYKARDARRKADLQQIRMALEMYYDKKGQYPYCLNNTSCEGGGEWNCDTRCQGICMSNSNPSSFPNFLRDLIDEKIVSTVPRDPTSDSNHAYTYSTQSMFNFANPACTSNSQQYYLFTLLEKKRTSGDPDCLIDPLLAPFPDWCMYVITSKR